MIIYQIPKTSELQYDHIIGVIDCSGSMAPHWKILAEHWNTYIPKDKTITITFDTFAEIVESNILDFNINYHGGGGTSIATAFQLLEEKVAFIPKDKNILVLFISDGQDNSSIVLERKLAKLKGRPNEQHLDFICLGIGKEFPTFVAMRLRKLYHAGDDSIPAIFLIEYVSAQAFTNKFESLKPFFECNKPRIVKPKVCLFPWRENTENVYENSWVISDSKQLAIDGKEFIEPPLNYFDGIPEIFRAWAQTMHLDLLNEGESVVKRARKTLQIMKEILEEVNFKENNKVFEFEKETLEINETFERKEKEASQFRNHALRNIRKRQNARLKWFFDDVKNIAEGKNKMQGDQFEAAKLIGLGTIFGGFNQKILRLKHVTVDDYLRFREEFRKIYINTKLNNFSSQERSVVSLQNQKDLFLESDFLEGLELCKNQLDLFESLPLIGYAIRLHRNESSLTNPYFVELQAIAKMNSTVDTPYINRNKGIVKLPIGLDQFETINAVVPLLGAEDEDMSALINTKLFNLVMTFNVLKNPDSLFEEAYLALLANTIIYLLTNEPESEWRNSLLTRVYTTVQIILKSKPEFRLQMDMFAMDPLETIRTDKDQMSNGQIDLSKSVLMVFLLAEYKLINSEIIELILFSIFVHLLNQKYVIEKNEIVELLEVSSKNTTQEKLTNEQITEKVKKSFPDFFSSGDLERKIEHEIKMNFTQQKIEFDFNKVEKCLTGKLGFFIINQLYLRYLNKPISKTLVFNILMQLNVDPTKVLIVKDLKQKNEILENLFYKKMTQKFEKIKATKANVKCSKMYKLLLPKLKDAYFEYFEKIHREVVPVGIQTIQDWLEKHQIKDKVLINDHSLLPRNACLATECRYYLKPVKYISHHFYISKSKFPKTFHATIRQNYSKNADEVYGIIQKIEGHSNERLWSEIYGRSKQETLVYIDKVRKAYKIILG